jgi:hypothetical protein
MPPTVVFDWFWKPFKELPPPGKKWPDWKGRAAYVDLLEGEPVRVVLEEIEQTVLEVDDRFGIGLERPAGALSTRVAG